MRTEEDDRFRVRSTPGSLAAPTTARRRHRCDGHLNPDRHWIEVGERCVVSALPPHHPDIGNDRWWHSRFCMACCPAEFVAVDSEVNA